MATELPVGFAMALAMNEPAMKTFESLSPAEKESIVQQTHKIKSRHEMQHLVMRMAAENLTRGDD